MTPTCQSCGQAFGAQHWEVFVHVPQCLITQLLEREASAHREAWQLRKEFQRASKILNKGASQRLGPLGRMKLADRMNKALGARVFRASTELIPVPKD